MPRIYKQTARLLAVDATNENLCDLSLQGWIFAGAAGEFVFLEREYDESIAWRDSFEGSIRGVDVKVEGGQEAPMAAAHEDAPPDASEAPPSRGPIVRGHLRLVEPIEAAPPSAS